MVARDRIPQFVVLAVLVAGALAAFSSPSAPAPPAAGQEPKGQLVFSQGIEVQSLNPNLAAGIPIQQVLHNVMENLTIIGRDGKVEPLLAESWRSLDDNTWQFKLRKGIKFHNGEPFNAQVVKFTMDRLRAETRSPELRTFKRIARVDVVDDYTVNLVTSDPFPLLPNYMAGYGFMQAPKHTTEHDDAYLATHPVGTGAYRFVEWKRGDRLTLEANLDYWRGPAAIKTIIFRPIPEEATRIASLKTGESTMIVNVTPDKAKELSAGKEFRIHEIPMGPHMLFIFRTDLGGPIANPKVRQAINYAVDKGSIVKNLLMGYGEVLSGQPLSAPIFGFNPDVKAFPYDPEKAKKLLAEAGYPGGIDLTFDTPQGRYTKDKEVAEAVVGQLRKVGIRAKLDTIEWAVWMERNSKKTFHESFMVGWSYHVLDFDDSFVSRWTYWVNPEVTSKMNAARISVKPAERARLYKEVMNTMVEDPPVLFLYLQKTLYAQKSNLDFQPWDEFVRFWYASYK
jgi:peptide/nickel transport system substrate-binding protein